MIIVVVTMGCKDCKFYKMEFIKGTLRQEPFCYKYSKFIHGDASWFCDGGEKDERSQQSLDEYVH